MQSPFAEVFSIHKQQLCTDFEMQMEVIAKQLVDSFHKKLDEMEESCVQKSEEFMAEIRQEHCALWVAHVRNDLCMCTRLCIFERCVNQR